tara:strand:+ start:602 stop:940 length:339 start_codon:yes stop_codon:yes gene_type:complete
MANAIRGELDIELNGSKYKTKLSLNSLMVLERELGRSLIKVTQDLQTGDLPLVDIILILSTALKGGGQEISDTELKQLVWQAGYVSALGEVAKIITNSIVGDDTEGKLEAVT